MKKNFILQILVMLSLTYLGCAAIPLKSIPIKFNTFTIPLCFSSNGELLAYAAGNQIHLLSIKSDYRIEPFRVNYIGHLYPIISIDFSPDSTLLASTDGKQIHLWSVTEQKDRYALSIAGVQIHGGTGTIIKTLTESSDNFAPMYVAFSPDGKFLASYGERGNKIYLWSVETGEQVRTLECSENSYRGFNCIDFSPDGKLLAGVSEYAVVQLWSVETGRQVRTLKGDYSWAYECVAFSPDGKLLANGGGIEIQLWSVETGKQVRTLKYSRDREASEFSCVDFSPDGKLLASGNRDKTIYLWSVETGELIKTLTGHSQGISSVHFSPDGELLASVDGGWVMFFDEPENYTVKLWKLKDLGISLRK